MKKRLIPLLSTAVVASALAITAVSTAGALKWSANADFNYSITFTKDTGTAVLLQDRGGTYVASGNSAVTFGEGYFCTLALNGELSFDFDGASKAAGVEKFLSIVGVRVVADSEWFVVMGSNYENHFGNAGEQFEATLNEGVFTFPYSMNYIMITSASMDDIHITSISIYYECGTQSKPDNVTSLEAPTNLAYDEDTNILSWTGVDNAMTYKIEVQNVDTSIPGYSGSIDETEVELGSGWGIYPGNSYTMSVYAKHNAVVSAKATITVLIHVVDNDVVLEAETACLDRQRNWSNDDQASNRAYGLAFNARGQGMYYRYYAYEAGNRDVTVTYATGMTGSKMRLYANGQSYWFYFNEYTNWFGDAHVTADVTIQNVTMVQGWNELYLFKDGEESDDPQWGGYVQVDYITVKGTGNKYDASLFDKTSYSYSLEGEMGHWHHANTSILPEKWGGSFSLGFGLGSMDGDDDGVKFDIDIAESGTYAIRPVMGGNKGLRVSVDGGNYTSYTFGAYSDWNNPVMAADDICVVQLEAGFHYIDFMRDGSWFTFDRVVFEKIA